MNQNIQRIAIVRLSALGDIVNSAIVLQFIHQTYPNVHIEWITEEVFSPLLYGHPYIHKTHTIALKKLKKEPRFSSLKYIIKHLRSLGQFDIIIDMQGLLKSSIVAKLIGKNTHGFNKNSIREPLASLLYKTSSSVSYKTNIIQRNCTLVSDALSLSINDSMLQKKERIFPFEEYIHISNENKKNIIIVIGASWKSKKYPKEKVALLADALKENILIVWGTLEEKKEAEWICKHSQFASIAPKLSLSELISYISSSDLLIGNDTGPTHIAWAQNVPSITLFGPTNERMIYEGAKNKAIHSTSQVNIFKINKNDFSIQEITVQEITSTAMELLHVI